MSSCLYNDLFHSLKVEWKKGWTQINKGLRRQKNLQNFQKTRLFKFKIQFMSLSKICLDDLQENNFVWTEIGSLNHKTIN
jgi:hypothetical protein